jgi:hypothetical protein
MSATGFNILGLLLLLETLEKLIVDLSPWYVSLSILLKLMRPIFVMDEQMSVLKGSANAIPRRVMVSQ